MGKALIIAEKPSVAADIAKALGGFKKVDDHFESDHYVLASAVGHLVEICEPEEFEVKRGKWSFGQLPVIPPRFDLRPIERTEARLKTLARLIRKKEVEDLINACDAGREGELIFRYVVQYVRTPKPIRRLWLQSMTPAAIRDGFAHLRPDASLRGLADAAVCRSESDWLVGINGTRALTAFNSRSGGFQLTTVGRVQTPTLAIVVERETRIRAFVPREYWELEATFQAEAGTYTGRWIDETFAKTKNGDADLKPERIWEMARAEALRAKCLGRPGTVTEESKPSSQASPLLYDLTSLQREANGRFGFSASSTLKLAQSLYERHKALTYPRTDSRHLPEDYPAVVRQTLEVLGGSAYAPWARQILEHDWVRPTHKRIFNNERVSDHFAIIPTPQTPAHLTDAEAKLYDMVTRRFLAVFFPAAEYLVTNRITRVESEAFKTEGKVLVQSGWLSVYGREAQSADATPQLVAVRPGETVQTATIEMVPNQTKPPPRFTEATLLTAMEGAGKLVEDEELREAMSAKGLGTPATRAAIIEGLLHEKYLLRSGRELEPTPKAFSLITLLNGLGIPELCLPELTGDWEFKLRQIERGQLTRAEFMHEITGMTRHIVEQARNHESDTVPGDFGTLQTRCPKCGGVVKENYKKFQCQTETCGFWFWKTIAGRQFDLREAEELLAKGSVGPLQGFRSKRGAPFAAIMKLSAEHKVEFDFGQTQAPGEEGAASVDFSGQEPIGTCPKCAARVFEHGMNYLCEKAVGAARTCDFRTAKIILQQEIDRAQIAKLLASGKTDLLPKFISKRNGRPFKAFLVIGKEGTVGFEFEPRPAKPGGAAKASSPPAPALDFTGQEPLGKCPRCGGAIFHAPEDYVCERIQAASKPCNFKVRKTYAQRPLELPQLHKLLETGRTDLLEKFISKRGRPFAARLVLDKKSAKVTYEFPDNPTPSAEPQSTSSEGAV
jgi:DNA topoisomerase-3